MILHSLLLQNFRQHENTRIDFARGLTGVIGANGTGKTSVLEAIAFALYGLPATRGNKDGVRFSRAHPKAAVSVELDFELSGHRYVIKRGISSAEMYLVGQVIPLADSVKAVNALVAQKLGMSRDEFFSTFFTGQKELAVMAAIGPTERGQFISRILGYEKLEKGQELVRESRRSIAADLHALRASMPDKEEAEAERSLQWFNESNRATEVAAAENALREFKAALAELTPRFQASQAADNSRRQLTGDLRVAESELASRTREVAAATAQLRDSEEAVSALADLKGAVEAWPKVSAERDQQALLARHDARRRALVDSLADAAKEHGRLCERRTALEAAPKLEPEVRAKRLATAQEKLRISDAIHEAAIAQNRAVQDAETRINQARFSAGEVQAALETITAAGDDGQCPTCLRTLEGQAGVVRDALLAQIAAFDAVVTEQRDRIRVLAMQSDAEARAQLVTVSKDLEALDNRLARIENGIRELGEIGPMIEAQMARIETIRAELSALPDGYDAATHAHLNDEIERLRPLVEKAKRLQVMAERSSVLFASLHEVTAARDAASYRANGLARSLSELPPDDFNAVMDECERAKAAVSMATLAHERALGEQKAAAEAVKRAEAAVAQATESAEREVELVREHAIHDALDRAYAELRTDLNKAVRPEIARLASEFLSDLTDGRYTELDLSETYELQIIEDGVPKGVISGGESDVANLVLRLAISQMIAERSGQSFSLLILDEVFSALDHARRANAMALMQSLKDRFPQIVIITHDESVRDACDSVLQVSVDPETGASVLRSPALPVGLVESRELVEA